MLSNLLSLPWVSVTECMSPGAGGVRKGLINQLSMEGPRQLILIGGSAGHWVGSVGVCDSLQSLSSETEAKGVKWGWKGSSCYWRGWDQPNSGTGVPTFGRPHCLTLSLNGHRCVTVRRGVETMMSSIASCWPSGYLAFFWVLCDLSTVRSAACARRRLELMLLWPSAGLPCFF